MRTLEKSEVKERQLEVVDAATLAAIDKAETSYAEGKGVTVPEARKTNRNRYQEWLKIQQDPSA